MAGTISTLGIGSGLELQSILDQLKAGEQAPITKKKAEQLVIKDRISEFDTLQASLLSMKDKALGLSLSSTYLKRKVSLSDTKPASVIAQDGIDTGSYNLEVTSLAQKSSWKTSTGVAAADSYVNSTGKDMQFSYSVGTKTRTLNVASGTTISQLAAAINDDAQNLGIKATVSKDGSGATPYKLLLQSNTLGEAGRISDVSMAGLEQWNSNSAFTTGKMTVQDADSDWPTNPVLSGTWNGASAGTYAFTESSGTAKTIGVDEITLNWTGPGATTGSIVVPAGYTAGTKISGPDGMEFAFTPAEVLAGGEEYEVQVENSAINSADTNFVYTYNGATRSVAVPNGSDLRDLADLINNDPANTAGSKVTASLVDSGNGSFKLKLAADTFGADVNVTSTWTGMEMTDASSAMSFAEEAGASGASLDAVVKLDGVSYTRASNTITDIVEGLTIKLQATGQTNIEIAQDAGDVGTNIKDFISNLVKFLNEVDENDNYDKDTKTGGSLFGLSSFSSFRRQLVNQVLSSVDIEGSNIKSLVDLGLDVARDGTISLDTDTLDSAIKDNFEDVKKLMLGDPDKDITGWADTINNSLRYATRTGSGLIATEKAAAETKLAMFDTQIERAQALLDKRYEILTKQFQALDKFSSSMNSMSSYLTSQFDSLSNAQSSNN
ncbi:flagellar filament capping protein FliD [Desulforegula conservatrix]|uniref:flagellar filament capping protein FliD n=1 Tax=Desulforegula conservatrix TaxID=153026 RepID=UPI0004228D8C|nr:flagellar filament capping protein FliD [Desulforegula conservatrix]